MPPRLRNALLETTLLAVWELTKDEGILREAYEKAPTDLMVGVTAFQSLPLSNEEKKDLAQRLQDAHPESALGSVLAASLAAMQDDKTEFRTLLGGIQQNPGLDLDISARAFAKREALMPLLKSSRSSWIASNIDAVPWHLQHFDEAGAELYFQIKEQRGEQEALQWAETYNGPAPKPEPATK